MSNFDSLVKYGHASRSSIPLKHQYYYHNFHTSTGETLSLVDIMKYYDDTYLSEGLVQSDIVKFLGIAGRNDKLLDLEKHIAAVVDTTRKGAYSFALTQQQVTDRLESIYHNLVYTSDDLISYISERSYTNIARVEETESEIWLLTKHKCFPLIFKDFTNINLKDINVTFMKYKTYVRFNVSGSGEPFVRHVKRDIYAPILQVDFTTKRGKCYCTSRNYLTVLKFIDNWSIEQQHAIVSLFTDYTIVASKKTNIKFKYIPRPIINKALFTVLRDVMFSGDLGHYILSTEVDTVLEKKLKDSFQMGNRRYNVVKPDVEIIFKATEYHTSPLEVSHAVYVFEQLVNEFFKKNLEIIEYYERAVPDIVLIERQRQKKTKQLIDKLREAEPDIFGKKYTQDCQRSKQPYIVESEEEFESRLKEALKSVNLTLEQFLIDKAKEIKKDSITLSEFLLWFPDERSKDVYPKSKPRLYACVPRTEGEVDKLFSFPFPQIQDNLSLPVPCCFKLIHDQTKRNVSSMYKLSFPKPVPANRKGGIPPYIGTILNEEEYWRFGVDTLEGIITRLANKSINDVLSQVTTIGITDSITIDYIKHMLEKNVPTQTNIYIWSYLLQKNITAYTLDKAYNSILLKVQPWSCPYQFNEHVMIGMNSIGSYEIIRTRSKISHGKGSNIAKFLEFTQVAHLREYLAI